MTTTFGNLILSMKDHSPSRPAVKIKQRGQWRDISWKEYYETILQIASSLRNLGLAEGEHVAIMSNTRWEWALSDLATLGLRGVVVPIYQNSSADEVEYILNHSEAKYLICENKFSLLIWRKIREKCPQVKTVICFEIDKPDDATIMMWSKFLTLGEDSLEENTKFFESSCRKIKLSDMATLVYTSGTMGLPKGVVLTHEQIYSEVTEVLPYCGMVAQDITLTFLPFAHVLGRLEHWGQIYLGYTMAYAESIDKIRYNLPEIQPTVMVAVPRIFEKVYSQILAQVETNPLRRHLFQWALEVGKTISHLKITRQRVPLKLLLEFEGAKKLVLNRVAAAFGGRLRFAVSGGAPISQDLAQFFHASGILILEGYGLTETSAAITANVPYNYKFGSVGQPIGDVKIRIAEDGEILVKSKKVMKEYYKDPKATAESFSDGWFHTGDIGQIIAGGSLKITDRKKDLIKTAGGKYVAPQKIEGLLKSNPLIANAVVYGDQKKFIVCLVTADRLFLETWAKDQGWDYGTWTDLLNRPEVIESIKNSFNEMNSKLANHESVKKFKILPTEFTIEAGELTPSMKVKRKFLSQKFKKEIDGLYE